MQNKVSARISIVVPVLNELKTLTSKYDYFRQIEAGECELIFVDGGSSDGSGDFLKSHFRNVYFSAAGRATQMAIDGDGLASILQAGEWSSPALLKYISETDLDKK